MGFRLSCSRKESDNFALRIGRGNNFVRTPRVSISKAWHVPALALHDPYPLAPMPFPWHWYFGFSRCRRYSDNKDENRASLRFCYLEQHHLTSLYIDFIVRLPRPSMFYSIEDCYFVATRKGHLYYFSSCCGRLSYYLNNDLGARPAPVTRGRPFVFDWADPGMKGPVSAFNNG